MLSLSAGAYLAFESDHRGGTAISSAYRECLPTRAAAASLMKQLCTRRQPSPLLLWPQLCVLWSQHLLLFQNSSRTLQKAYSISGTPQRWNPALCYMFSCRVYSFSALLQCRLRYWSLLFPSCNRFPPAGASEPTSVKVFFPFTYNPASILSLDSNTSRY